MPQTGRCCMFDARVLFARMIERWLLRDADLMFS